VACELHGDTFRDPSTNQIADGGSPKVVRDSPRATGRNSCFAPGLAESGFCDALARPLTLCVTKDEPGDEAAVALQIFRDLLLIFEHAAQFAGERKGPGFVVLCGARIEPHLAGTHIDLPPFQRQDLARRPPTRDVRERRNARHVHGQMALHRLTLLPSKNPFRTFDSLSSGM
jgi:hypothetical protein